MKIKKRLLSILLSLALMLGLLPGMSLTAYATTYSGFITDDLQVGDILKPGAEYWGDDITVILQANGWGDEYEMSTYEKQFSVRELEISEDDNGSIWDNDNYNYCYPYANGEKVSSWKVVSIDGGEEPWDPKTITLTGYAPPARVPVTEISSDTKLSANINSYITITDNVTLDLAGYTITGGGYHSTIIINNGYTLTLIDSSTGQTGKITGGGGDAGGGVAVGNNATFDMKGGTISGNTATNGGGVALGGGATFTMSGGTITGNSADNGGGVYSSGSSFSMTGGTISNNSAGDFNYGGGVLIQSGSFSMSGTAAITGNDGGNNGGGVYFGGSTFTMSGGSISGGNHASTGGGVYVKSGAVFTMTGGTITGNSTDGWVGGGVYTSGIFNMSGSAAITGNRASTEGGGVYQDYNQSAVFTMTGGSITNNSSGSKGYAGVCIREKGTFNLSGGAVIDGNTHHGSTEEDICLYPGSVVKVTGALTMENTMSVRLTDPNGNENFTGTIAQGSGYTLTETDGAKFVASTTSRRAKYDSENSKEILVALYTVTYNPNGATSGTVPTDENNPYESGSTVTVLGNTGNLVNTSHNFNGWNTAANGGGTPYAADATFNIERNTTLYAQWEEVPHVHSFTYEADGATITATCTADGCTLDDGTDQHNHAVTLTLSAADATYSGSAYTGASLSDTTAWTGAGLTAPTIEYAGRGSTSYTKSTTAPTNAGTYTASITVDTDKTATANFTISPVALTIDAATATNRAYDKDSTAVTISAVTFKDGSSNPVALTKDTDYTVTGAMTDINAGSGKTVNVTVTLTNSNYSLATNTTTTTVDISKAAAQTIADVTDTLVYTATSVSESVAGNMPSDAGTLSYTAGTASKTGSVTVSDFAVDANGNVTATLSGGAAGDIVTLPVTIGSTNYANSTVNVVITLTAKDDAGVSISGVPTSALIYGDADFTLTGSVTAAGTGTGTWTWSSSDDTVFQITPNGATATIKILKAGSATITASYESDTTIGNQATAAITVNTKTVTIQAKDQGIYVGGEIPSLVGTDFYTVTGLVGEETLTTNPTLVYQQGESKVTPDNTTAGTYDIVPSGAAASDNYSISYTNGTLTISNKGTQTITAENVTVTYGDTGKSVSATVTEPATGGGDISYAVKDGSGDYIDVNASTGALTIKKVGSATVIVTAAETATYAQATKEVTVTINKANAVAATVTANNRTYDGTAQPLVTVTGEATDGEMQYALGTATEATEPYTTSIPAKTEAGTYYVWYKVIGDANHNDSDAKCIEASIAKTTLTITADAKSKTAGEADPELTYTVKGLVEGDKLNGALSRVEGEEAGEYDIKQGTLSAGDNYSIVFTGAKLTIKEKKKITYTAYSGNGATWKKGSEEGLTLTFKRSEDDGTTIDHFTGITVAGKAVDKDKYSAVAGSVVITLKSEYLETLEAGEYLLAAQFDDGEDAEATFTIANADKTDDEVDEPEEEKADDAKVDEPEEEKADDAKIEEPEPEKPVQEAPADNKPKTSDNMNVPGVLFVMDLALLGMIVVMLLIGREKKKRR